MTDQSNYGYLGSYVTRRLKGRRAWLIGAVLKMKNDTMHYVSFSAKCKAHGIRVRDTAVFAILVRWYFFGEDSDRGVLDRVDVSRYKDFSDQEKLVEKEEALKLGIIKCGDKAIYKAYHGLRGVIRYGPIDDAQDEHVRDVVMTERMRRVLIKILDLKASPRVGLVGGSLYYWRCAECKVQYSVYSDDGPSIKYLTEFFSSIDNRRVCLHCTRNNLSLEWHVYQCAVKCGIDCRILQNAVNNTTIDIYNLIECVICRRRVQYKCMFPKIGDYARGMRYVFNDFACCGCRRGYDYIPIGKMLPYYCFKMYHVYQDFNELEDEPFSFWYHENGYEKYPLVLEQLLRKIWRFKPEVEVYSDKFTIKLGKQIVSGDYSTIIFEDQSYSSYSEFESKVRFIGGKYILISDVPKDDYGYYSESDKMEKFWRAFDPRLVEVTKTNIENILMKELKKLLVLGFRPVPSMYGIKPPIDVWYSVFKEVYEPIW